MVRGIRVITFSGMEYKAFHGFGYEIRKKAMGHFSNLSSAWFSFWPALIGLYALIKTAEKSYEDEQLSHRD
jgi:hypothetical protein